ncbi:MAG TPA: outer membrane beta-barrel protein, partial [Candidatus Synoicihabitans sp.]|nr:outer membrane beta-barrel protein [Candidatus Synoicihabitans sp.]
MKTFLAIFATLTAVVTAQAQFYAGAGVGYLIDSEEEYITAKIGYEVATAGRVTHAVEIEAGLYSDSASGIDMDMIPVTANYRGTVSVAEKLGVYFGGGLGAAFIDIDSPFGVNASETAFAVQGFGGVEFRASDRIALVAGARYIWVDEISPWGYNVEVGD